ncbi:hypothetical protein ASG49_13190 [Marmoricola sp. Leaf446]|uniref:IclR family transcriptional regulator n=1 Tax=Marmoricola sp. Leaf446 TaxID=1736379 RepID=UPI0006FD321E|nr:IclR family transcriptional regulator [Marmoricola sp. Leaf446]KQT90708.1 hypothetical protein ASG49_13190 [Marmoricola sp. Leaf446]
MTGDRSGEGTSGTQAVDRAAALLTRIVEADGPVTFGELTEEFGLARSTTSRLLAALERGRLVERTGPGAYRGGPLFVLYAARHDRTQQLARLALPMLEQLGEETRETSHLAVANGGRLEHVAQVDGTYLLGAVNWNDVEVPLHCSALGKVLLAWKQVELPEGRLAAPTDQTITLRSDLEWDLEWVREHGYAVTHDELEIGLSGVAAPVFGPDDDVVAAVGVSGPTARLEQRAEEVGQLLVHHARTLSRRLQPGTPTEGAT